jgi:multidrug transporter EmrE-like cation transporter
VAAACLLLPSIFFTAPEDMLKGSGIAWWLLISAAFIDTFFITVLKMQCNKFGDIDIGSISGMIGYLIRFLQDPVSAIAAFILIFSPFLSFIALSHLQLSRAYPVLAALHLFFVEIFSLLLLHETASGKKAIGLCCLVLSIFLIYSERTKPPSRT